MQPDALYNLIKSVCILQLENLLCPFRYAYYQDFDVNSLLKFF